MRFKEKAQGESRECPIHDTFVVEVGWLSPRRETELGDVYFKRGTLAITRQASDAYQRAWCREVIRGWRGLTLAILEGYLGLEPVDEDRIEAERQEREHGELRYTENMAFALWQHVVGEKFAQKIRDTLEEWRGEDRTGDYARKKSSDASSASSSTRAIPRVVTTAST